jgi:hypothetical protein
MDIAYDRIKIEVRLTCRSAVKGFLHDDVLVATRSLFPLSHRVAF